ncbi:ROK family glucokinase [Clostridium sp. E02]|uniref:ROK family glucokinase n=1 Tax=Clostridium sp. E02 TaxID=2487134 RepID=UPI000F54AD28|nr:ROK family glucokinase [Clostridium sp. E02]
MGTKCIGIDVGGTTVKIGIFEHSGELLKKWEVVTRKENSGSHILTDVSSSILKNLEDLSIPLDEVKGVGLGVPGPVMPDGYVEVCVNLGWKDQYPGRDLSAMLQGIPVICENDANVAALGEMWQGGGKGFDDLVMVTLGTGVGGGVIRDQKIVSGKHGLAGEIGHMHVREDETERCNCGGVGCLEQIASATGIAREARRQMSMVETPSSLRAFGDQITAKEVFDAAKAGDELARKVVERFGHYMGIALAQTSMIMDPEVFVIGGGVSRAGTYLIDEIYRHYDKFTPISKSKSQIVLATLGNDAGIYGAARMILD